MHDHDQEHQGGAVPHAHLTSVGIDIGSSTSHLMFSQLVVGYPTMFRPRPEVLEQKVVAQSPIMLTPFAGDWNIQAEPLRTLFDDTFRSVRLRRDQIDTGAVIITGEAARRDNARQITELFSREAGRFVCATAGPRLETLLAAHGSGAVARSRNDGSSLLNVDIGGGTTKISLVCAGKVEDTTAINLGARLIAYDKSGTITRLEKSGKRLLCSLKVKLRQGEKIADPLLKQVAAKMAMLLFDALAGKPPPWPEFHVTPPLSPLPPAEGIIFSGGVSEYIYGRETALFGDLGLLFGAAVRQQAAARGYRILPSTEGIRATVIGASQYSMQLSGQTVHIPSAQSLPLKNVRILVVQVDWDPPVESRAEAAIARTLNEADPEVKDQPYGLFFKSPAFRGYGAALELARAIRGALTSLPLGQRPMLLIFERNIGRFVGETLGADLAIPCVDEIALSELDFVDVGTLVEGQGYVPVVVKSLAFGV
ncbi:MAG: ethanolamine ammonia-lyase reactivating factor EutA [Hyphomicrobiales bacterium]|nr:ethanolamine ammonia-lyase reactivating factor EutA [Hyphomicrobiales bacterium]